MLAIVLIAIVLIAIVLIAIDWLRLIDCNWLIAIASWLRLKEACLQLSCAASIVNDAWELDLAPHDICTYKQCICGVHLQCFSKDITVHTVEYIQWIYINTYKYGYGAPFVKRCLAYAK
jgi:hypothetical protein